MTYAYTFRFPPETRLFRLERYLNERLDLTPLGQLLRSHSFGHLQGVTLDTSDDGVGEGSLLGSLIILLDNDDLPSGLASLEDNSDLAKVRLCECRLERIAGPFRVYKLCVMEGQL